MGLKSVINRCVQKLSSHYSYSPSFTKSRNLSQGILDSSKLHYFSYICKSTHLRYINISKGLVLNTEQQTDHKSVGQQPFFKSTNDTVTSNPLKELSLCTGKVSQKVLYNNIVEDFPEGIQMAFAYGSGVFQQNNSFQETGNMLDFIFVVDKPKKWHSQNLERHSHHYSFLKKFGPHTIARIQER